MALYRRPRLGQLPQRRDIDFGVDLRGRNGAVPKDDRDLVQRGALPEHRGGERMPEEVGRSPTRPRHSRSVECAIDDHRDRAARATFGTTAELLALRDWLGGYGVTHVAMESTGVYWKPIFYVLEDAFRCVLANAAQIAQVPGRKTDVKDCVWIAQLLEHGLVRGSFVSPVPIRELRDSRAIAPRCSPRFFPRVLADTA